MCKNEILVIGGDDRQYYMTQHLRKAGFTVWVYGTVFEDKKESKNYLRTKEEAFAVMEREKVSVVLPVPVTVDKKTVKGSGIYLEEVCPHMKEKDILYGGNLPEILRCGCEMKQGQCRDFMKSEHVAWLNAVSTAEGSIAEACMLGKSQLTGSNCLVLGYGRCGEVLADKLKRFGANVTVMERKKTLRARAQTYGLSAAGFETEKAEPGTFEYIFNTVPALVIDEAFLLKCGRDVVIVDIASAPGGVDYRAAEKLGITAKLCLGLPGKYAPKTAGEILADVIIENEREMS